ncbi:MAG: pirin-like C-terminal cupin domain-containing protein [Neisseria sp.]|nr:pirin-like C-terminal cupin domain-containing protein [Neisseria sp.]
MWEENGVKQTLLVGTWCERQSEVQVYTPLLAVDVLAQQEVTHRWALQVDFEYGILPLEGSICVNGQHLEVGMMAYVAPGSVSVEIAAEKDARYFIIGGEPLHEELIVWWNLIARTPEEIAQARAQWEAQSARFGDLPQLGEWLHAPELSGSLKASGPKQNT